MEIVLNKILPEAIVKQVAMFRGQKSGNKADWKDMMIRDVKLRFVSTKDNACHGTCNYFKIIDSELLASDKFKEFEDKVNYSPFWKTDSGDYLVRVHVSKTEQKKPSGSYVADVKLNRYSSHKVDWFKGICYDTELIKMRKHIISKQTVCDDPFAD